MINRKDFTSGTIGPGNSIGTLTIDGDYTSGAGRQATRRDQRRRAGLMRLAQISHFARHLKSLY